MSAGDRSAGGEGSVAGWQRPRKQSKVSCWAEWTTWVRVFILLLRPRSSTSAEITLLPFKKTNSPNVPDEKWPNKQSCCSLCDKADRTYSSKDWLSVLVTYLSTLRDKSLPCSLKYGHITCKECKPYHNMSINGFWCWKHKNAQINVTYNMYFLFPFHTKPSLNSSSQSCCFPKWDIIFFIMIFHFLLILCLILDLLVRIFKYLPETEKISLQDLDH